MRLRLLPWILIVTMAGCSTTKLMDGIMASWEGRHVDAVISQWGLPDSERTYEGHRLYVWTHETTMIRPFTTNTRYSEGAATTVTRGGTTRYNCTRAFEVSDNGYVVGWDWAGNNCPHVEGLGYKEPIRHPRFRNTP